jgi:FG-GAP repeat
MRIFGMLAVLASIAVAVHAEQKLVAPRGAPLDQFGYSVAISGDTLVAGSLRDFVTVFTRVENVWAEQATFTAPAGWHFGIAVAIDGDTIAIGAYKETLGANTFQGSVYIFVRNDNQWTQQAKLVAGDGDEDDVFGYSVALDGDTVVVGAPGRDHGVFAAYGAAYVFTRTGTTWTQRARLLHADGFTSDNFGLAVAVHGNTIVVSTNRHDVGLTRNQGAAWVYSRSGNNWIQQAKLIASDAAEFADFGASVDVDGSTIVVGSLDGANDEFHGAAYIFERSGVLWREKAKLTAPDAAINDRLGFSVAIEGDTVVAGSLGDDIGTHLNQGSVHIFKRDGETWSLFAKRTAFDGAEFDILGYAVAISGDSIAAGAPNDDTGTGSVHVLSANAIPARRRAARK